jgi:hypothetical protein
VCLQGASALEKVLSEQRDPRIRVFVVWEPVLPTDLGAPSTMTLRRVSDLRVSQYWDKEHLVSRLLGERDHRSVFGITLLCTRRESSGIIPRRNLLLRVFPLCAPLTRPEARSNDSCRRVSSSTRDLLRSDPFLNLRPRIVNALDPVA